MKRKYVFLMMVLFLYSSVLTCFSQPQASESGAPAGVEERERAKCSEQMSRIHKGIFEFYREHKHLPGFLSDLAPKYCRPEEFICPAKSRVGDQAWARQRLLEALHDPKLGSTTYSYEFNSKLWGTSDVSFRQYKSAQRDYLGLRFGQGDYVPIVRCFLHDRRKVLNITYGGAIVETGLEWEEKFGDHDFIHRELTPRALLPRMAAVPAGGVPARREGFGPEQLDLTTNYNALISRQWFQLFSPPKTPFAALLEQPEFLKPVKFDVRGVIQLKGEGIYRRFPLKSGPITIGRSAGKLHFLLGAYGRAEIGEKIGQIQLNFADETVVSFEITYGVDLLDWRDDPAESPVPKMKEKVVWLTEELVEGRRETIRLYDCQVVNPNPEKKVESAEFDVNVADAMVSKSAPALFAITLDP